MSFSFSDQMARPEESHLKFRRINDFYRVTNRITRSEKRHRAGNVDLLIFLWKNPGGSENVAKQQRFHSHHIESHKPKKNAFRGGESAYVAAFLLNQNASRKTRINYGV